MTKILSLFFALCALIQLEADDTLTWASPTQISSPGINATTPVIATDSSGNVTAVWVENGNIVTNSLPFGGSWGVTNTTLDSSGNASSPHIGMASNGNAVAVWLRSGVVEYATLTSGSWTIGSSDVSSNSETASNLSIAADAAGDVIAVWQNSTGMIETATMLSGQSWSLVSVIMSTGTSNSPSVAIGNGIAVLVWHNVTSGAHSIFYSTSTLGGSWSTAGNIIPVTTAVIHNYPKVAVDPFGNATAVWYRYTQTGNQFFGVVALSSTLSFGGAAWTAIPTVISNPGYGDPSTLALRVKADPFGNVVAMFMQSFDGANFTFNVNAQPFGGVWATPAQISVGGLSGPDGDMQMNSIGDAVAVFMNYDGTNVNIQSADSFFGGFLPNIWTPVAYVSSGTDNGFPRVATSYSNGVINAVAVWTQFDGTNIIVNAATGSRMMLVPPSNLTVVQNTIDYGVFKDYQNTVSWTGTNDPNAIGYIIFRNGIFLANLSLSQLSYIDESQVQNGPVTYGIASVDGSDQIGPIQTYTFSQ